MKEKQALKQEKREERKRAKQAEAEAAAGGETVSTPDAP